MAIGENTSGSDQLTVDSAADRLVGLLSGDPEDTQEAATPQETPTEEVETPQPEESDVTEQPDPEEESTEEEPDEEPQVKPQTRRLKVGNEEVEVTDEELEKGYLRQSDYTRKTQELANSRKTYEEQELPAVRREREEYANRITQLVNVIEAQTPKEPDWATFRQEHPDQFADAYASWSAHKEQLAALQQEQQAAVAKVAEDRKAQFAAEMQAEKAKLIEAVPTWKDAAVAKREMGEIAEFARTHGFSDEELGAVTDHRVIKMLRMAMQQDRAAKNLPTVRQKIENVKTAKPGSAPAQKKPTAPLTRAKQRLGQTHRVDDAAAAIAHLLD